MPTVFPRGTYLDSCDGARVEGASLIARCRGGDGMEHHSALLNYDRCVGDIGNNGGVLGCNMGWWTKTPPPPPLDPPVTTAAVRCDDLSREVAEPRPRRGATFDPILRAQVEGRPHGVEDQLDYCAP
jgi:hypothetical protein